MHELRSLLDAALATAKRPPERREEAEARAHAIAALFRVYRERDVGLAEIYVEETREIPWRILRLAIKGLVHTRVYPSLPAIGDLFRHARTIAGMNREQYHAGRYFPAPRQWPPEGKRYAITAGEYERLPQVSEAAGLIGLPALPEGEG